MKRFCSLSIADRPWVKYIQTPALGMTFAILTLVSPPASFAQQQNNDVDVSQLRNELSRNKESAVPTAKDSAATNNAAGGGFQAVSDETLELRRRQLLAKEAELLKALESGFDGDAPPPSGSAQVPTENAKPPTTSVANTAPSETSSSVLPVTKIEPITTAAKHSSHTFTAKGDKIEPPLGSVAAVPDRKPASSDKISEDEAQEIESIVATEPAKAKLSPAELRTRESKTEQDLRDEITDLRRQLSTKSLTSSASQKLVNTLEQDNVKWKRRNGELLKELDETRNRLLMAEKQVERLSEIVQRRNSCELASIRQPGIPATNSAPAAALPATNTAGTSAGVPQRVPSNAETKPVGDLPIAVVVADKALFRSGPGKEHSPITSVARGTRLVVESNQGQWYRVYAPNGSAAWVSAEVLQFVPNDVAPGAKSFIKIKPIDPNF